jgi:cytochrome c oxidase subunit IV
MSANYTDSSHNSSNTHNSHTSLYTKILFILLFLTIVTVAIARVDFGSANLIIAMLVASIKAMLVAMFFMHLKYEHKIVWLYALIPVVLLVIMLIGVFIDAPLRTETFPFKIEKVKEG